MTATSQHTASVELTVGQVAQTFGIVGTSASVGTVISAVIPVLVVILAALRPHQPVTGGQQIGIAAAFAGSALVASGHSEGSGAGATASSSPRRGWGGAGPFRVRNSHRGGADQPLPRGVCRNASRFGTVS